MFQSLKGFQPKWNSPLLSRKFMIDLVSIPKRVSAKVEPGASQIIRMPSSVSIPKRVSAKVEPNWASSPHGLIAFQSLKGFQPKWNSPSPSPSPSPTGDGFQSLKGFQPKWNAAKPPKPVIMVVFQSLKGFQPKWNHRPPIHQ